MAQSICLHLCLGSRNRATSTILGEQQRLSAHPSAFRWSKQKPPPSCLEGVTMFEEALAAAGVNYTETVLMEAPLKATATRQEETGQDRHVCPWAACVGQWPAANPLVASVMFFRLNVSIQVVPRPWKTNTHPSRDSRHTLVPAAIPSAMHTPKSRQASTSFHIQCAPRHRSRCSSSLGPRTFMYISSYLSL